MKTPTLITFIIILGIMAGCVNNLSGQANRYVCTDSDTKPGKCIQLEILGDDVSCLNIYEQGTVTASNGKKYTDYCSRGNLIENYCNKEGQAAMMGFPCGPGYECKDGACVAISS